MDLSHLNTQSERFQLEINAEIEPLKDSVLVHNLDMGTKVQNGIILLDNDGKTTGVKPRWAQVYKVGSEVDFVSVGEWVLISHGRWTRGVKIADGTIVRMVDSKEILLATSEKNF